MEYKGEEITGTHIVTGVFSFFTIALGRNPFRVIANSIFDECLSLFSFLQFYILYHLGRHNVSKEFILNYGAL
jgi:hypothetical protein